jgi:hypothetical protein
MAEMKMSKTSVESEKRLKTIEKSIKELIVRLSKIDKDVTEHVVTPDAHNAGYLSVQKSKSK